ncbi:MAG TPA: MarR family winged helix-turn-helix transcriptional regulator [Gaiellaceae bacterium]|nr:MarR family winged helix-turn-helix transcriptional regulator [Gaiellaceae bacterium]
MTTDTSTATMNPRLPGELVSSTTFLLKRLGFAAKEKSFDAYERAGLHPYHYAVLAVLDEGSRETQGQIADALGYDRGQLVGLLDELEERGLIERKRDPSDRRRQSVRMTADGKRTLTQLRSLNAELEDGFLGNLDDSQRAQLHELLVLLAQQHLPHCAFLKSPPSTDG